MSTFTQRLRWPLALATLAVVVPGQVLAFKFIQPPRAWRGSDLPVPYHVGEAVPMGLNEEEKLGLLAESYAHWDQVRCSPLGGEYAGSVVDAATSGFGNPDMTVLTFDYPGRDELGSGPLAATVTHSSSTILQHAGQNFYRATAMNIIYNEGILWGAPDDIESPSCAGAFDFVGVSTHEIGHGFGLGHSCDDGEPCEDPVLRGATMFWSVGACDESQRVPNEDDTAGINAIYGVVIDFDVTAEEEGADLVGAIPLTATLSVPAEFTEAPANQAPPIGDSVTEWEWNFGDGTPHIINSAPDPVTHTWEREGEFTVSLTIRGESEDCGEFETTTRKVGVVLACAEPVPAFAFENLGDNVVAMDNRTSLSAFGCISTFQWLPEGADAVESYEPRLSFEAPGDYPVTLRAIGPGGTGEVQQVVTVTAAAAGGCNASLLGASGSLAGSLFVLLGMTRRRRA
jgi:PKD repeat protein